MLQSMAQDDPPTPPSAHDAPRPGSPSEHAGNGSRARKRTKTGCLTCRKRRIKCGEERPICANCIKSKRSCEGYAARLTFKDPVRAFPPGWAVRGGYQLPPDMAAQYIQTPISATGLSQFSLIAPRPAIDHAAFGDEYQTPTSQLGYSLADFQGQPYAMMPPDVLPLQPHQPHFIVPSGTQEPFSGAVSNSTPTILTSQGSIEEQYLMTAPAGIPYPAASQPVVPHPRYLPVDVIRSMPGLEGQSSIITEPGQSFDEYQFEENLSRNLTSSESFIPIISHTTGTYIIPNSNGWHAAPGDNDQIPPLPQAAFSRDDGQPIDYYHFHPAVAQLHEEDDYYDVESDEEMQDTDIPIAKSIDKKQRDLAHVLSVSGQARDLRSVGVFLNKAGTLANYVPKFTSSPLMDEDTARIFCHFVTATGPLMSGYGRHPVNPALLFSGTPVPKSQQALWTYTIPMLSISNQGLLHAILAVASLNIARLEQAPLTVPTKHYQFALRRVAKAVATPGKRTAIATVAATILLSQFEILSAEHSKWHSHLAGARQLFTEVDFTRWTSKIHAEKARKASSMSYTDVSLNGGWPTHPPWNNHDLPWIPDRGSLEEDIFHQITGSSIKHAFHGRNRTTASIDPTRPVSEKEIDDFQTYRDLFWMYAKIDNIQSIVTGRRLLLPLDYWINCPPRAPMDRFDAVYGTLDHLTILMGRVADFAGKDVFRKKRAVKANGGAWMPSGSFFNIPARPPPSDSPPLNTIPPQDQFSNAAYTSGMTPPVDMRPTTVPYNGMNGNTGPPGTAYPNNLPSGIIPQNPTHPTMMPTNLGSAPGPIPVTGFLPSQSSPEMPGQSIHQTHISNTNPTSMPMQNTTNTPHPVAKSVPATPPTFSGLFPTNGQSVDMPAAFNQAPRDMLYQMMPLDIDLELSEATAAAEAEWNHIQDGLDLFEQSLGEAFAPLPAEVVSMIDSPFGPALQYRTFQIATCWLLFYMTRVIAIRTHPAMPPASTVAAAVAAGRTANYCNILGRINAGLLLPTVDQPLNPIFGGAVTETMLPMFVAGVQYMDNAQRTTTIERLRFIADRLGHNSAAFIAAGLERTWIELHKAGRGPPYRPTFEVQDVFGRNLMEAPIGQHNGNIPSSQPLSGDFSAGGPTISPSRNRTAVVLQNNTRSFAAGLIGLEESLNHMSLGTAPI